MTVRSRQHLASVLLWFLPIQLLGGMWWVLHAQPPAIETTAAPKSLAEQKLSDDLATLKETVKRFEDQRLDTRLQVLEVLSERSWRIELLVLGLFVTSAGHLILQAWMHRTGGSRRHRRLADDDEKEHA